MPTILSIDDEVTASQIRRLVLESDGYKWSKLGQEKRACGYSNPRNSIW